MALKDVLFYFILKKIYNYSEKHSSVFQEARLFFAVFASNNSFLLNRQIVSVNAR